MTILTSTSLAFKYGFLIYDDDLRKVMMKIISSSREPESITLGLYLHIQNLLFLLLVDS